jgi:hypothetical protein
MVLNDMINTIDLSGTIMKCYSLFFIFFISLIISGCTILSPKPFPSIKTNIKETYSEKTVSTPSVPSSNTITIVTEKSYTKEDLSQSSPIFVPQPEPPTFFQRVRNFIIKYSLILGVICFLFPSVGLFIVTFIYKRTRNALSHIVEGIENFKEEGPEGNKELLNNLSKSMDKYSKKLVKRIKAEG